MCLSFLKSSIGKKQIVAVTGLALILFLVAHLAGNFIIFMGPEAFNAYAKKLAGLRPALNVAEAILLLIFFTHMHLTALLVWENIQARGKDRYAVNAAKGNKSWATKLMPYSGTYILIFVIWHLLDFTFTDHHAARSILSDGKSYGLYGVVWNSFADPVHSLLYVVAMMAIGLHLSHGLESFCQTFGFNHPKYTPIVKKLSEWFGLLIALGYSSIPIYILLSSL